MADYQYELELQRLNTAAYIESDSTDVAFVPRARVSDGSGGTTWSNPAPLAVQKIRVVTTSSAVSPVRKTVTGENVSPDLLLVCPWDAQIASGYLLTLNGDKYEVIYVDADMKYEKLAEVIRRG